MNDASMFLRTRPHLGGSGPTSQDLWVDLTTSDHEPAVLLHYEDYYEALGFGQNQETTFTAEKARKVATMLCWLAADVEEKYTPPQRGPLDPQDLCRVELVQPVLHLLFANFDMSLTAEEARSLADVLRQAADAIDPPEDQ